MWTFKKNPGEVCHYWNESNGNSWHWNRPGHHQWSSGGDEDIKFGVVEKRNLLVILSSKCWLHKTCHNYGGPKTLVKQGNLEIYSSLAEILPNSVPVLPNSAKSWGFLQNTGQSCRNWGGLESTGGNFTILKKLWLLHINFWHCPVYNVYTIFPSSQATLSNLSITLDS